MSTSIETALTMLREADPYPSGGALPSEPADEASSGYAITLGSEVGPALPRRRRRTARAAIATAAGVIAIVVTISLLTARHPSAGPAGRPTPTASTPAPSGLTGREVAIARTVGLAEADRFVRGSGPSGSWPALVVTVSATAGAGTISDSNTGHPCLSGTLIHVQLIGRFPIVTSAKGEPPGATPPPPDNPLDSVLLTADLGSGQVCLLAVEKGPGAPQPDPGATIIFRRPKQARVHPSAS
jgi:hypothetical protein